MTTLKPEIFRMVEGAKSFEGRSDIPAKFREIVYKNQDLLDQLNNLDSQPHYQEWIDIARKEGVIYILISESRDSILPEEQSIELRLFDFGTVAALKLNI